uniref:PID domain-containing protein n=1 Tax=Acrobeloides nanus TaxID=290746 RepID=A0A914C8G7_9BILA
MHVCEGALQHLRGKKRVTKAILYISGDGLRVVDQENNRGLVVDQTIEKVSFCSPDRHNDKGFAYICRDGATRRWMCHGFMAIKESGERLSHAVGCAFGICLEKKKKREAEVVAFQATQALATQVKPLPTSVSANGGPNGFARTNAAYNSFRRQLSITERKQDPQTAIINEPPPTTNPKAALEESLFKPRPAPNPSLFDRQGSFKAPGSITNAGNFRRFNSLRSDLMPIQFNSPRTLHNEPIYEGDETWPDSGNGYGSMQTSTSLQFNHLLEGNKENGVQASNGVANQGWQESPMKYGQPLHMDMSSSYAYPPGNGYTDAGPLSNRSMKADEWLEQTFKASLNLGSTSSHYSTPPITSTFSHDSLSNLTNTSTRTQLIPHSLSSDSTGIASANFGYVSGPPPAMPPPPLPPAVILRSPEKSVYDHLSGNEIRAPSPMSPTPSSTSRTPPRKSSSARKSIEYQILEEVDAPLSPPRNTPIPPLATNPNTKMVEVDVFGQPVFNPTNAVNTTRNGKEITPPITKPVDPFDVKWSTLVLQSTTVNGQQKSTPNPFSSESASVNV